LGRGGFEGFDDGFDRFDDGGRSRLDRRRSRGGLGGRGGLGWLGGNLFGRRCGSRGLDTRRCRHDLLRPLGGLRLRRLLSDLLGRRRRLLGRGLGRGLGRRLARRLLRLRLFRLLVASQALTNRAPADHVGVGLVERGRVALHGHAEDTTEVDDLLVRHPELLGQLVQPHVLRHVCHSTFHSRAVSELSFEWGPIGPVSKDRTGLNAEIGSELVQRAGADGPAPRSLERLAPHGEPEARRRRDAQPCPATRA
jgi:hypothetical protein